MAKKKIGKKGVDALKKVAILSDLTDKELEHILAISKIIEIPADDIIMTEGEVGSTMYFFVDGEVKVSKNLTLKIGKKGFGKAEKSMVKLKAEHVSFFGDMAMFQDEPRSATITASSTLAQKLNSRLTLARSGDFLASNLAIASLPAFLALRLNPVNSS